jgi:hypothetical protein
MADNIDQREAELLARLEAEREQRFAEKIAAGEIVSVPIMVVAGSEASARAQVEQAKADKLKELHDVGDQREVVFAVNVVITGVVQHGEARDPERAPTAPGFASGEDAPIRPPLPSPRSPAPPANEVVEEEAREEPPLVETPISVQIRACRDDDDPGEIAEGYFSPTRTEGTLAVAPCWRARMHAWWRSSYCAERRRRRRSLIAR